jgi:hypothetical protein
LISLGASPIARALFANKTARFSGGDTPSAVTGC